MSGATDASRPGAPTPAWLAWDEALGGMAAVLVALVLTPAALVATSSLVAAVYASVAGDEAAEEEDAPLPPVEVIETRFVRFGAPPDPRRLPDRYVPSAATAPPEVVVNAPNEAPSEAPGDAAPSPAEPPPSESAGGLRNPRTTPGTSASPETPRPADAVDDLLTRLGDRAGATAELSQPRVREGDAEGIAEGTATRDEGDVYLGRLYTYFRRGWRAPTSISDAELNSLRCVVEVDITADARVGGFRITGPSGNADFDASVRQRLTQAMGSSLPAPPADAAERFLGRSITLRFLGRNAR